MTTNDEVTAGRRMLLAFYTDHGTAKAGLESLLDEDFPPDRISLLGRASASGDDPLGIYYTSPGERMKAWGGMGAFWGGLWGLLTGAAGVFLVPGLGPVAAAGPLVEAITGAAAGAGLAGGAMAGGAALSQVGVAIHRMGVPAEALDDIRDRLAEGQTLLLVITGTEESDRWRKVMAGTDPDSLQEYPYTGFVDAVRDAVTS